MSFAYGTGPPVLDHASLQVDGGQSGFLLGPSGCGKSTLLRCIAGLETSYTGTVRVGNDVVDPLPPHRRHIGMLFQEPALFPHLDVAGNVAFGVRYRSVARSQERTEARRWLDHVGLAGRADDAVDELSGGQRQRVALARTLAARPRAVLLDEPLSSLDTDLRLDLGDRLKTLLADQGVPALWVTHDRQEALRLGDRVWQMHAGRVEPVEDTQA